MDRTLTEFLNQGGFTADFHIQSGFIIQASFIFSLASFKRSLQLKIKISSQKTGKHFWTFRIPTDLNQRQCTAQYSKSYRTKPWRITNLGLLFNEFSAHFILSCCFQDVLTVHPDLFASHLYQKARSLSFGLSLKEFVFGKI